MNDGESMDVNFEFVLSRLEIGLSRDVTLMNHSHRTCN